MNRLSIYVAEDGKIFYNRKACIAHEKYKARGKEASILFQEGASALVVLRTLRIFGFTRAQARVLANITKETSFVVYSYPGFKPQSIDGRGRFTLRSTAVAWSTRATAADLLQYAKESIPG